MKSFTQKLIVLAVAVMLVSLVLAGACQATTATFKNVSIGSVSGKEGEKVKVEIKATEDLTVEDGGLLVKFDSKKLKFDSVATATIADTMMMASNRVNSTEGPDGVVIGMVAAASDGSASTIKKGTVIATITFEILKGAKGTQTLTLVDDQDEAQTAISTGKVTATEATTTTTKPTEKPEEDKKPSTGTTEGDKKPSTGTTDTEKKPTTNTDKKPTTSTNNKKDKTPTTGVVDYVVVGSMITVVAIVSLAVISKRKSCN